MDGIDPSFQSRLIELKHELTAHGQLPAHRCQHCAAVLSTFNPPLGPNHFGWKELFTTVETKARVGELAKSGCNWWSLISSLIRFIVLERDPYDPFDPELPPALKEHASVDYVPGRTRFFGKLDSNQLRVCLDRFAPLEPHGKIQHSVIVLSAEGAGRRRDFTVFGHPSSSVRGTEHLASPINVEPSSASSFALAKHWIDHCAQSHSCGILDAPTLMPRILLSLRGPGMDNGIRITETEPQHLRSPYVALSYCWGQQDQKVVLKKQTKSRLLKGISLNELDLSIQDAIRVTRELGFSYLWIDALCIMQDDSTEKAHDVSHMHGIYRNAAFTIIASRAASVTEGFLSSRQATGAKTPNTIFSLVSENDTNTEPNSIIATLDENYENEPWEDRAWTLQERLSSGRFLRFGNFQTQWSCQRGGSSYQDCDGWRLYHQQQGNYGHDINVATDIMNGNPPGLHRNELLEIWQNIVVLYTRMELTYAEDRLPAISSIARAFARVLDDDYICGLWRPSLHVGLLWKKEKKMANIPDISWSWASSSGRLSWLTNSYKSIAAQPDFRLLEFLPKFASDDDIYGAAESAMLTIQGLMVALPYLEPSTTTLSVAADAKTRRFSGI